MRGWNGGGALDPKRCEAIRASVGILELDESGALLELEAEHADARGRDRRMHVHLPAELIATIVEGVLARRAAVALLESTGDDEPLPVEVRR